MQEDCWAIADAINEKKMQGRGPGCPQGMGAATQLSAATCNTNDWVQGLYAGASNRKVGRTDDVHTHNYEWGHAHVQCIGGGRWHRWQVMLGVPRCFSRGSPSSGGGSSDCKSNQSSLHSTMTGASSGSNRSAHVGSGPQVKVNLLIFKDEKSKDAVTYHSWQWDMAISSWSGWDDQHLLPDTFCSLQGFPGDLASSLGEDATLNDVLWMLDEHYSVIMMFNALSKELYSLKQGLSQNIAEFRVHLSQQV